MRNVIPLMVLAATLAACATGPTLTTDERLALYREHAGEPTGSFRLDRTLGSQNWTPLGDQALAVWSSANRGHLLELRSRCSGLGPAARISITKSMGDDGARLDSVVVSSAAGSMARSCRIETIRPIDGTALREAKRELRDAEYIDRSAAPPEETPSP